MMRKRDHLRAWANHAALNVGVVAEGLLHVVVPPQVDHTAADVGLLASGTPWEHFLRGAGMVEPPKRHEPRWWVRSVMHNCVVHPWLPFADAVDLVPHLRVVSAVFYRAHDRTAPVGAG